ncbi:MAG: FkbM family methyltransferase [Planctomycetota bacterium]|nr:MAG: FkbM family methyltransferase [Planctomycetota bacterium]REJ89316.1 MAG: FkbM family methyltransferase [Planctomycetota bacterium]REK22891.1 MAG: FkbM family methyltransferase [Planctomycetota bacterium]REK37409.1 MAG: FkbM family methyltransferase [Planctomycetota bacterium]
MSSLSKGIRKLISHWRKTSYALNELDLKLERYLDFDEGFFVEAGANDGIKQSNTLLFEKYRKWCGLLIEPVPELYRACCRNRPRCAVENAALVPLDYADENIEMRYCDLMSVVAGGMKSAEEEQEHIDKGCEIQRVETHQLTVPARSLTSILDEHQVTHIDLLSLDVEGYELSALQGLDFARYQPLYMLIEARYREEIDDYLAPHYAPVATLSYHDVLYQRRL